MGALLSLIYKRRWYSLAGVGVAVVGAVVQGPVPVLGAVLVWSGVALVVVQLPVSFVAERRTRSSPPGSN